MLSKQELEDALSFTVQLARDAGKMIRDGQARRFQSGTGQDEKLNSVDLVTEVDKAVEAFITEKITARYPKHKFIGEETYEGQTITDDPTWIVDPIDGTTNFIHGYPMVATSIGLAVEGVPVLGVIYNPFVDQLYSAAKGFGAYLNGNVKLPMTGNPPPLASLGQALIGVEYGSSRTQPALDRKMQAFKALAAHPDLGGKMCHSLRSGGSAALNAAMVAAGSLDIYWEIGPWPWDACAAIAILQEAGGAVFGAKGTPMTGQTTPEILAGRKFLFVRAMPSTDDETSLEGQQRLALELMEVVEEWDA